jgi:hypothetical protein
MNTSIKSPGSPGSPGSPPTSGNTESTGATTNDASKQTGSGCAFLVVLLLCMAVLYGLAMFAVSLTGGNAPQ